VREVAQKDWLHRAGEENRTQEGGMADGPADRGDAGPVEAQGMRRMARAEGVSSSKGGVLTVWSAAPDTAFALRLRQAGFQVEEVFTAARNHCRGGRHTIWLATRI